MARGGECQIQTLLKKKNPSTSIDPMARQMRKELADLRAMEEENARMTMHGGAKHFIGAGATPSMGLSQFRGGAMNYGSEDEDDMEGGSRFGNLLGAFTRGVVRQRPPSSAIVPFRPPPRNPITTLSTGQARPSMPSSFYRNLPRGNLPRLPAGFGSRVSNLARTVGKTLTPTRIAQLLAIGIPFGMLGDYLRDQNTASGDAGFYDDFAGDEFDTAGMVDPETGEPLGGPLGDPSGLPAGGLPDDLSPDELAFYLRSGNLPQRYSIRTPRRRRGKGKLTITHGEEHEGAGMVGAGEEDEFLMAELERLRQMPRRPMPPRRPVQPITGPMPPRRPLPPRIPLPPSRNPVPPRTPVQPKPTPPPRTRGAGVVGGKVDGRSVRAGMVKKIMNERGVSLAEASRIVKSEGLY